MGEHSYQDGHIITNEGDVLECAFVIQAGRVELSERLGGKPHIVAVLDTGKVLAEQIFLSPGVSSPYTARALGAVTLQSITYEEFKQSLSQCPASIMPYIVHAFEKMKSSRVKQKEAPATAITDLAKITLHPASEKMSRAFQPMEITLPQLPFRIGGYPEQEEINRRYQMHLYLPSQSPPLRVSRQHCEIVAMEGKLYVQDLGSRFRTIANEVTLGRGRGTYVGPLQKGDNIIMLGSLPEYSLKLVCE